MAFMQKNTQHYMPDNINKHIIEYLYISRLGLGYVCGLGEEQWRGPCALWPWGVRVLRTCGRGRHTMILAKHSAANDTHTVPSSAL